MAQALDQSIREICEKHDLLSLSMTHLRGPHRPNGWYSVNVQWADDTQQDGRSIAGKSADGIGEALAAALAEMTLLRVGTTLTVEALQIAEAA